MPSCGPDQKPFAYTSQSFPFKCLSWHVLPDLSRFLSYFFYCYYAQIFCVRIFSTKSMNFFNSLELWICYLTSAWNLIKALNNIYEVFSLILNIFRLPVAPPSATPRLFYAALATFLTYRQWQKCCQFNKYKKLYFRRDMLAYIRTIYKHRYRLYV